ncbi:hypothetical protein [Alteraurantiacibacter aquimixticola]|uniref:Uncharacterized protein n=1 Tax=Alteraurantiacibacter aquimixticola TaxID=2489173 RepID=A0A4T3F4I1_9SPHN|nr:hypothetical protein [Alteraurantiacibacter aquimixticola]TIX51244.1 hypothetical protein E5222_01875 [Alteraurantiacibacter aquimixticola]
MSNNAKRHIEGRGKNVGSPRDSETGLKLSSASSQNEELDVPDAAAIPSHVSGGQQASGIRIRWWAIGALVSLALWYGIYLIMT